MRPIRIILVVTIAVALAVVAAALSHTVFASSIQEQSRFTLVVDDPKGAVVPANFFDNIQPNAQGSEDAPVLRDGKAAGLAETVYTVTRVNGDDLAMMVECSVELPEGNILFNGTAFLSDLATGAAVPVVGGTGRYAGMSGTVVMSAASDGTTTLEFDISPAEGSSSSVGMPRTGSPDDLSGLWLALIVVGALLASGRSIRRRGARTL